MEFGRLVQASARDSKIPLAEPGVVGPVGPGREPLEGEFSSTAKIVGFKKLDIFSFFW